jgi:hypothetical protein
VRGDATLPGPLVAKSTKYVENVYRTAQRTLLIVNKLKRLQLPTDENNVVGFDFEQAITWKVGGAAQKEKLSLSS